MHEWIGLIGILAGLVTLVTLAYRGWSVLLVGPTAAVVAATISGQPLLASWTQVFVMIGGTLLALTTVIALGMLFGTF